MFCYCFSFGFVLAMFLGKFLRSRRAALDVFRSVGTVSNAQLWTVVAVLPLRHDHTHTHTHTCTSTHTRARTHVYTQEEEEEEEEM